MLLSDEYLTCILYDGVTEIVVWLFCVIIWHLDVV